MDDMVDDILIQVLQHLPITEVFRAQRVSRSFNHAAQYVIACKRQLQIGNHVYRSATPNSFCLPLNDRIVWNTQHPEQFRTSLLKMRSLKTLILCGCHLQAEESLAPAMQTASQLIANSQLQVLLALDQFARPPLHYD